jgi:hypothetical protein
VTGGPGLGCSLSPRRDGDPRRDGRGPVRNACARAHLPGAHRREGSRRLGDPGLCPPSRGVGDPRLRRTSRGPLAGRRPVDGGPPHRAVCGHRRLQLRFRPGRDRMARGLRGARVRRDDLEGGRVRVTPGSGGVDPGPCAVRAACNRLRSRRDSRGRRDGSGLGRSRIVGDTCGHRGRRRGLRRGLRLGGRRLRRRDRLRVGRGDDGSRLRCRVGGRLGRLGRRPCRQKRKRVEVPVRVGRNANAEVNVRNPELRLARRADRADDRALLDRGVPLDRDRAEVDERDRVPVVGANRHRQAVGRNRAGECDGAASRCQHGLAGLAADLDSPALAARVGIAPQAERTQQRSGDRPGPRPGRGGQHQRAETGDSGCSHQRQHAIHRREPRLALSNVVTVSSQRGAVEGVPRGPRQAGDELRCLPPRHAGGDEL